jgi:hypothetical protein
MLTLNNWSYSRYATWKKCPALLKFQTLDTERRAPHPAAQRGLDLHKSVELYLRGGDTLLTELEYYKPFLGAIRDEGALSEYKIALDDKWSQVPWDSVNYWWRGVLDAVIVQPENIIVYDWKTGQEYPDHRDQREIYAAAIDSMESDAKEIDVFHVYLDKKQNTHTKFLRDEIPMIRTKWEGKAGDMLNDQTFAPNPGFYCRSCPYRAEVQGPCPF